MSIEDRKKHTISVNKRDGEVKLDSKDKEKEST